jgi:hypothetical protein
MSNTVQQANPRANPLAIVALVVGFGFPRLAIPVCRFRSKTEQVIPVEK